MKHTLFVLLSLMIVISSCASKADIEDLQSQINGLSSEKIAPIEQQINGILSSIGKMESTSAELKSFIETLQKQAGELSAADDVLDKSISNLKTELYGKVDAEKTSILNNLEAYKKDVKTQLLSINEALKSLQEKDYDLQKQISELKKFVDEDLKNTKDWAVATFATLAQNNALCQTVASVQISIESLNKSLSDLEMSSAADKASLIRKINTLSSEITTDIAAAVDECDSAVTVARNEITAAYKIVVKDAVSDLETSMKSWVHTQLSGYYTIAQMDAKLMVLSATDSGLQTSISGLTSALETEKANLTAAYTKAIRDAINSYNGQITAKIASDIKAATDALQSRVNALDARLTSLESMIQSVIIVPAYSDGSVRSSLNGELQFTSIITPASVVSGLSTENFKILANTVITKGPEFASMDITSVDVDGRTGKVDVTADVSSLLPIADGMTLSVALNVKSGPSDFTSPFVIVSLPGVPEAVDLGLSVKWASFNLGASKPEEYGGYYQWAGTKDVSSIYLDWNNCPYHTGSNNLTGWTKYIPSSKSSYWSGSVNPDNKTVLDPEDDVAHVYLGGSWRMPTVSEWDELRDTNNCSWTWTSIGGINGFKVQSEKSGFTDKWIFLPAAGNRRFAYILDDLGSYGAYWSSSLSISNPEFSFLLGFRSYYAETGLSDRVSGKSVRPVSD